MWRARCSRLVQPNVGRRNLYTDYALPSTFSKVLIANRGEIACRVIRTARRLGLQTVAVYSDADRRARHVRLAHEAYCLGAAPPTQSYLRGDEIIRLAKACGAQAIHPGYGFLSENVEFAKSCVKADIEFIGPPADALSSMASKSAAKTIMMNAKVPVIPGFHGEEQDAEFLAKEADKIGYPLMIKAILGGGGKGMRVVASASEFRESLEACKRESLSSFGDDRVLLERFIRRPRHVEFQIFADKFGNVVHLFERDCSVQRRHQKVLEEAPAPGMTDELRAEMGTAAVNAVAAVGYVGAGTVEFMLDADSNDFFYLETNTRLQVEHPVTEMIIRRDLVQLQLHVAAGHPLPFSQRDLKAKGHAIEARIYAENPDNNFLPCTGAISHLSVPKGSEDFVRVETGVSEGDTVSVFYDPMIAKLVVWDMDRERALQRMFSALGNYEVTGLPTNIRFLRAAVSHDAFRKGGVETNFIDQNLSTLLTSRECPAVIVATAAAGLVCKELQRERMQTQQGPWALSDAFRVGGHAVAQRCLRLCHADTDTEFRVVISHNADATFELCVQQEGHVLLTLHRLSFTLDTASNTLRLVDAEAAHTATFVSKASDIDIFLDGEHWKLNLAAEEFEETHTHGQTRGMTSPMPGKIVKLFAKQGDVVHKGDALLSMEAMKMEHVIRANSDGVIGNIHYSLGEFVEGDVTLVTFEHEQEKSESDSTTS